MKTKELIEKLTALVAERPELADVEVTTAGCDCDGDVGFVIVVEARWSDAAYIYLERSS